MTRRMVLVGMAVAGLALAGCGDDGGDGGDVEAYCDLSAELDEQEEFPSDEQLDQIAEFAPSEISDQIDFVVDTLKEDGPEAFEDPDVDEAFDEIEAFESENCDA